MAAIELVAAGDYSTNVAGGEAIDLSAASTMRLDFAVTSFDGGEAHRPDGSVSAPRVLNVWLEHSPDGSTAWARLRDLPEVTENDVPVSHRLTVSGFDAFVRAAWKVRAGRAEQSSSAVFSLDGDAA